MPRIARFRRLAPSGAAIARPQWKDEHRSPGQKPHPISAPTTGDRQFQPEGRARLPRRRLDRPAAPATPSPRRRPTSTVLASAHATRWTTTRSTRAPGPATPPLVGVPVERVATGSQTSVLVERRRRRGTRWRGGAVRRRRLQLGRVPVPAAQRHPGAVGAARRAGRFHHRRDLARGLLLRPVGDRSDRRCRRPSPRRRAPRRATRCATPPRPPGCIRSQAGMFDATVCHAYKWLCSPRGVAFLTVSEEFQTRAHPDPGRLVRGGFGVELLLRARHAPGHHRPPLRRVAGLAGLGRRRAGGADVRRPRHATRCGHYASGLGDSSATPSACRNSTRRSSPGPTPTAPTSPSSPLRGSPSPAGGPDARPRSTSGTTRAMCSRSARALGALGVRR